MNADARRGGRRPGASSAREDILHAGAAAFAEFGYDRATIRDIASRAEVDPPS
jgi:AcrR family transcriptional regulator